MLSIRSHTTESPHERIWCSRARGAPVPWSGVLSARATAGGTVSGNAAYKNGCFTEQAVDTSANVCRAAASPIEGRSIPTHLSRLGDVLLSPVTAEHTWRKNRERCHDDPEDEQPKQVRRPHG